MNNTFIKMLAAIEDPAAIERAYQMMAAKRYLLAQAGKPKFNHSYMEPRPIGDVKCPDMVELARAKAQSVLTEAECVAAPYKLAPSISDIQFTKGMVGVFRLEIHNATPAMVEAGFNNGDLFTMESVGYNRSTMRSVKHPMRTARIHNRYLRLVFATPTGGRYHFPN